MAVEWSRDWSSRFHNRETTEIPEAGRGKGGSYPGGIRGSKFLPTLGLRLPASRPGREQLAVVLRLPVLVVCNSSSRRSAHQANGIKANTNVSHYGKPLGACFMNAFVICHCASVFDTIYPVLHRPAIMLYLKSTFNYIRLLLKTSPDCSLRISLVIHNNKPDIRGLNNVTQQGQQSCRSGTRQ